MSSDMLPEGYRDHPAFRVEPVGFIAQRDHARGIADRETFIQQVLEIERET